MTAIKYIDSKQFEHLLEIDDDASEAEYLTICENYANTEKLSTIDGKREIAYAVCQIIPNLPRTLGYFDGEFKFKMPPVGLMLEIAKIISPKINKLTSIVQQFQSDYKPQELSPEERERLELEARLAELNAKKNTAGASFGANQ